MEKIIATIIKDEHEYLEEWIDYHFSIGFGKCILCGDIGSKPHKEIVERHGDKVEFMEVEFSDKLKNHHMTFYRALLKRYEGMDAWIAAIDVDEYLELEDCTLDELLSFHSGDKAIQLWWQMMTANGHVGKCKNVRESYTEKWAEQFEHPREVYCKFIWNCKYLRELGGNVHAVKDGVLPFHGHEFIHINEREKVTKEYLEHAYLKHYYTKSLEDWKEKCFKGRAQFHGLANYARLSLFFLINKDMKEHEREFIDWYWEAMSQRHGMRKA